MIIVVLIISVYMYNYVMYVSYPCSLSSQFQSRRSNNNNNNNTNNNKPKHQTNNTDNNTKY